MSADVSTILERRAVAPLDGSWRRALGFAFGLHGLVLVAALVVPRLLAVPPRPVEFVEVRIVPAVRLGIEKPQPAPPVPEVKKPEPVAEPKPESKAPVLPDPKLRKKPEAARPKPADPRAVAPPTARPEVEGSPKGAAGGLALGKPTATFDALDFTYGYYVDQMLAIIGRNWTRPPVGSGVEATIHFRIQKDGRLSEIRIASSSGINSFDLAALRAVQASSPLAPLPGAFRSSSLGVNLIVR